MSSHSATMLSRFLHFIAVWVSSGFGSGYSLRAPGTVGSVAALIFWVMVARLEMLQSLTSQIALAGVTTIVGTIAVFFAMRRESSEDPQWIVIDEWAGLFIALVGLQPSQWVLVLVAWVSFRFFDVSKIGPVGVAERVPGAVGIMGDDVVAGLLAGAVVWIARVALPL